MTASSQKNLTAQALQDSTVEPRRQPTTQPQQPTTHPHHHFDDELAYLESHGILDTEYEHTPVPAHKRRPLRSVAAVWLGFPMIMTSAVFGGTVTYNLGLKHGLLALVVGNLILMAYVGSLSYIAGHTGESFALTAAKVFGSRGSKVVSAFLSTLVVGWFAIQTGMVGDILSANYGMSATVWIAIAGVLFVAITFLGIRALAVIGVVGSLFFVVVGIAAVILAFDGHTMTEAWKYTPGAGSSALTFGACVTVVVACFIDSGTMTADFTRWARNGKQGTLASFAAFPVGNFFAQVIGALVVAIGAAVNPGTNGGDFMHILVDQGGVLSAIAFIFVLVNLGSVCSHCLYNGAVGWSQVTHRTMRGLTLVLGVVGVLIALLGVTSYFLTWLNFLGAFVPPIGAVVVVYRLADFRRGRTGSRLTTGTPRAAANSEGRTPAVYIRGFIAWACGAAVALACTYALPAVSSAVVGIIVAAAVAGITLRGDNRIEADTPVG